MILISGAGIAGLTLGLTLYQIGVPFRIFERAPRIEALGVGINVQPNAVRELFDLGLQEMLDRVGLRTAEVGFYAKTGREIWREPRGLDAGYRWPQFSIHRGRLQAELHAELLRRAGPDCVVCDAQGVGFEQTEQGVTHKLADGRRIDGALLIACDGIHSAIRRTLFPDEGDPLWSGAVLWRGTTKAAPFLSGASVIIAGHDRQRLVAYPITPPAPETGHAVINWIAERKFDASQGFRREDWTRNAERSDFAPLFDAWRFDWLDVPALIAGAGEVYEYPMVDRDPLPRWTHGRVSLMGDAAHPTYPVGSNGASQAIVDARVLGAEILRHGVGNAALEAYEARMRPATTQVVLANRGAGPDAILERVEQLSGGDFAHIDDVILRADLDAHAARYKAVAGMSIEAVNAAEPTISMS
ncbi:MAG: flavin-dependent oxidoreductase [Pseudomonadota bacterium]